MTNRDSDPIARRMRARFVRRAIETDAPLLAAALHRYAQAEGMGWPELAASLECSEDDLNQIALCRPPRPDRFAADVEAIAADFVAAERLLPLLRRLQILNALADAHAEEQGTTLNHDHRTSDQTLLAARDREEPRENQSADAKAEVNGRDREGASGDQDLA